MLFFLSSAAARFSFLFTCTLVWTTLVSHTLAQVTSGLVQCAPAQIQVGGGTSVVSHQHGGPVLPVSGDGTVGATPLETFPALNHSGAAAWLVNVPSGTTVRLGVRDGTGAVSYSDPITVQAGQSDTCLSASSASGSSVSPSATSSSSASESTSSGTTTPDASSSTTVVSSTTITTTSEITSGSSTSTTRLTITSLSTSVRPPSLPNSTSSTGGNASSGSGKLRSSLSAIAIVLAASAFVAF
ncbi:hypothetical protein BMF94_3366 [Rhodotorula taiwanensis]|uniref:Uncharacterized protein n=1 Tax=Rhodotorula taiwanensis TaxID=741276 RepID=A0A2S5BAL9_9BASI|nr:hypothetical protein BMF94_3366 [Rhodotorula taiwanensis]